MCLRHLKLSYHPSLSFIFTSLVNFRDGEKGPVQRNTQDKVGRKRKAPSSEEKEMAPLYTDMACNRATGIATWEVMYNLLEEENPRVMEVTATMGSNSSFESFIIDLACSFLHWIEARPKILPYMDMVKWILDSVDIRNRQFKTQGQEIQKY